MIQIEEYMLLPLTQRQAHINLSEACVERGGRQESVSAYMRGVLSYVLNTTIPYNKRIHACHACNNWKCGNIAHIYWGTVKENNDDAKLVDSRTLWQRTVDKYGEEKTRALISNAGQLGRLTRSKKLAERNAFRAQQALTDGRKVAERNSQFGTCWLRKEGKEQKVKLTELEKFIYEGWERGRSIQKFVTKIPTASTKFL